eukprot:486540_1
MELFAAQLCALLKKHWIQTVRRPISSASLVLIPAFVIYFGLEYVVVREWIQLVLPAVFVVSFLRTFVDIVEEKESRVKEGMKMMGLSIYFPMAFFPSKWSRRLCISLSWIVYICYIFWPKLPVDPGVDKRETILRGFERSKVSNRSMIPESELEGLTAIDPSNTPCNDCAGSTCPVYCGKLERLKVEFSDELTDVAVNVDRKG